MQRLSELPHERRDRSLAITLLIIVGLTTFIGAYIAIHSSTIFAHLDLPVLNWMVAHRSPIATTVMQTITTLADPVYIAGAIILGAGIWAFIQKELWRPGLLIGVMGIVSVTGPLLKHFVHRGRPPMVSMIQPYEIDFSFPSGHTFGIAVCVLILGYLLYSRAPKIGHLITWILISILSIGIVASSRLYLGYHWITDIIASVGLGLFFLAIIIAIDGYVSSKYKLKKPTEVL